MKTYGIEEALGMKPEDEYRYGDHKTISGKTKIDVEIRHGKVVAVWFRCVALPFEQHEVDEKREKSMERAYKKDKFKEVKAIIFKGSEP